MPNSLSDAATAYSNSKSNDYTDKAITAGAQKRIEYKRSRQNRKVTNKRDMTDLPVWMHIGQ